MTEMPILAGLVASVAAFVLTGLVVRFATLLGVLDDPTARAHPACLHSEPIPRGGGVALFAAIFGTAYVFLPSSLELRAIFVGASLMTFIGYLDDIGAATHPYSRLLVQFVAAGALLAGGVLFDGVPEALGLQAMVPYLAQDGRLIPLSLMLALLSVVWTVGLMNAVSWSSGVDGQISGVVVIAAFALACMGYRLEFAQGGSLAFSLATITAGAYAGFFLWHAYPQRIMPGFGGATLAGFLLAAASMLDPRLVPAVLTLLAVPLIDAGWIVLKRVLTRRNPVWGDAGHLHHHLLAMGWTRQEVAFFYWLATALFGVISFSAGALACGVILGFVCVIVAWINSAAGNARQSERVVHTDASAPRKRRRADGDANLVLLDMRPGLRSQTPDINGDFGATIRLVAGPRHGRGPHEGSL